jgi:hypothetical protein
MKMENQTLQIAQTIINQIKFTDRSALMAWGATKFIALPESKEFQGGVQFHVNGLVFQGIVKVELRWVDDYTVSFVKKAELKNKIEGVYCDMLIDVIDFIEGK